MSTNAAPRDDRMPLALTVNGRAVTLRAEPRMHLADVLREELDLSGTHLDCEHGICGACTVLLDGEPARACLTVSGACAGAEVAGSGPMPQPSRIQSTTGFRAPIVPPFLACQASSAPRGKGQRQPRPTIQSKARVGNNRRAIPAI